MRAFLLSLSVRNQLVFVIGLTIASAFLIALSCSMFFDTRQLIANTGLISAVYQSMGTLYAILLTFSLWGIWQTFTDAEASAQNEAYHLLNLIHMLESSSTWLKLNIRHTVLTYLQLVIEKEWPTLKSITNINGQGNSYLAAHNILQAVQRITPDNECESILFNHVLTLLNLWMDARRTRLLIARGNSAKALWPLLFTGAFVLFFFHGLFVAKTVGIWVVLLLGVSLVIGLTFYLIFTLDCPFTGSPSVDSEPFTLAINLLARDPAKSN